MIDYKKKYLKYKKKYLAIKKLTRGGKSGRGHQPKSSDTDGAWACEICESAFGNYEDAVACERWCTETGGEEYPVSDKKVYVPRRSGQQWNRRDEEREREREKQWADERQEQKELEEWQQWERQKQKQQQQQQQQQQVPPSLLDRAWIVINSAALWSDEHKQAAQWLYNNGYVNQQQMAVWVYIN